jgi:hypothetical protein
VVVDAKLEDRESRSGVVAPKTAIEEWKELGRYLELIAPGRSASWVL